ncbi:signal peptidase I [Oscillospiraceae bacterium MB08-C2-2]|nr:signal peptidase I [Oscillospiraceae bacterium MB08-C2-2]
MKKFLQIFSIVFQSVTFFLVALLLIPQLLGWEQFTVLTGSMEPALPVGSLIVVRPVEKENIAVGDIITFYASGGNEVVTHRALEVTADSIITQGDANNTPDPSPVNYNHIKGKLFVAIPLLGYLSLLISRVGVIPIIIIVLSVVALVQLLLHLIKSAQIPSKQE